MDFNLSNRIIDKLLEVGFTYNRGCYEYGNDKFRYKFDSKNNLYYSVGDKILHGIKTTSRIVRFKNYDDFIYYFNETFSDIIRNKKIDKLL